MKMVIFLHIIFKIAWLKILEPEHDPVIIQTCVITWHCKNTGPHCIDKYISPIQPQAFSSKNPNQLICIKEFSLIFCREILPPYTAEPYPINPYSLQDVNGNAKLTLKASRKKMHLKMSSAEVVCCK